MTGFVSRVSRVSRVSGDGAGEVAGCVPEECGLTVRAGARRRPGWRLAQAHGAVERLGLVAQGQRGHDAAGAAGWRASRVSSARRASAHRARP